MKKEEYPHIPVMLKECTKLLENRSIAIFFDATCGMGGHAEALLSSHPEIQLYVGCDRDPEALKIAKKRLAPWKEKVKLVKGTFSQLDRYLEREKAVCVDGILFDLGMSSLQIEKSERGFSFIRSGPLDMRMDPKSALTAEMIVNEYTEEKLGEIFREIGEEKYWKRAVRAIMQERKKRRIKTTDQLVDVLKRVLYRRGKIHPATRIFQALRIVVNRELEELKEGINKGVIALCKGGRMLVLSYHSLEDRLVKYTFLRFARQSPPLIRLITKKVIKPTKEEVRKNPRSRSVKLRCVEKM